MTSSPSKQQFSSNLNVDGTLAQFNTSEGLVRVSISGNCLLFETQSSDAPSFMEQIWVNGRNATVYPCSLSEVHALIVDTLDEVFPGIETYDS